MHIGIDPRSPQPLSDQIAAGLRHALVRGDLAKGDSLPPMHEMIRDLRVNPNAIRDALLQLEKEGLIRSTGRPGGYMVGGVG